MKRASSPKTFQKTVHAYFDAHQRDLPWRRPEPNGGFDPYKILVSECMLQQTQVGRAIPKFELFIQVFPTIESLAAAQLADVLRVWIGLGYNRRAKYLHDAASQLKDCPQPWTLGDLTVCKGVGHNTAAAVLAFAYNMPVPFVETNIRTVFIYHFADQSVRVTDVEIMEWVRETMDHGQPRKWFWALMDYGSYLKAAVGNMSQSSTTYTKQSAFHGSARQIRGQIIQLLVQERRTQQELRRLVPDDRLTTILANLVSEGLILKTKETYHLA